MQIQSEKGYDPPKIASFYEVNIPNSKALDVVVEDGGDISISMGSDPYEADLKELLHAKPVIRKKKYWILESRWASVFYPDWDTPLFFNKSGKQFCRLCTGKNTFHDILGEMVKANSKYGRKTVVDDSIRFLFLLKKLKLITVRRGN
ncbi:MAG: hypothetical protein PHH93_13365 [Prolixibacteraceae bacterium]|nr:hypothetical protein [Prolixibacteraceae bacterium]